MRADWTEDYNVNELGLVVGTAQRETPLYELTDEEKEAELEERRERLARRIPLGFRAPARPRRVKPWPKVPRFDVPPRRRSSS